MRNSINSGQFLHAVLSILDKQQGGIKVLYRFTINALYRAHSVRLAVAG